jgi:2-hydroxycyclohexanecarboxyl-CoA dehydrogenase
VAIAVPELGPVDIPVNYAGWEDVLRVGETNAAFWDCTMEINRMAVLRAASALLAGLIERGWGRALNIGSDAARRCWPVIRRSPGSGWSANRTR